MTLDLELVMGEDGQEALISGDCDLALPIISDAGGTQK